ncbi:hypothetical protein JCM11641_001588 [Rhodosporidiobolus odoratus]
MLLSKLDTDRLYARRCDAVKQPLESGVILSPTGPTIDRAALSQCAMRGRHLLEAEYKAVSASPHPMRPINAALLQLVSSDSGWTALTIRLNEQICGGEDSWAQVWTAEVYHAGGYQLGTVVIKLLAEALFWSHWSGKTWTTAAEAEKAELQAYRILSCLQGREVPHCYGGFPFVVPWGETVTGIILEDLSQVSVPLFTFCPPLLHHGGEDVDKLEAVRPLLEAAFSTLHRLQALGITCYDFSPNDILILFPTSTSPMRLVFLDFGETIAATEFAAEHAELNVKHDGKLGPWQNEDEWTLREMIFQYFPEGTSRWIRATPEERGMDLYDDIDPELE